MTSVAVALCTHNGARYIGEQLSSILDQTVRPEEIVLSDDASTDATVQIAESIMAERGDGIRFTALRNDPALGVARNFEQATLATSADLVALSDQDDVWHPRRVESAVARFDARPELLLLHGDARLVDGDGSPLGLTVFEALEASAWELASIEGGRAFEVFVRRTLAVGATTVFRRTLLDRAVPFGVGWVHDEWLAIMAASVGGGAVSVERTPLLDYRQHGGNQIGVRKLSLRGKLGRLREGRRERNERMLAASEVMVDRIERLDVPEHILNRAHAKLAHERIRSSLPASRAMRALPIWREWCTGRYETCGRGIPDAVRDLVQPVEGEGPHRSGFTASVRR